MGRRKEEKLMDGGGEGRRFELERNEVKTRPLAPLPSERKYAHFHLTSLFNWILSLSSFE